MWRSAARVMRIVPVSVTSSTDEPLLVGHLGERRGAAEAGVVHEHVEAAPSSAIAAAKQRCTSSSTVTLASTRVHAELVGRLAQAGARGCR